MRAERRNTEEGRLISHFHAGHNDVWATLTWKTRGSTPREVMVLRSSTGYAGSSDDPASDRRQTVVYHGTEAQGNFKDAGLAGDAAYYYTVFARDDEGSWHKQTEITVTADEAAHWQAEDDDTPDEALGRWHSLCHELKAMAQVITDAREQNPTRM
jgi:hypothetical protein